MKAQPIAVAVLALACSLAHAGDDAECEAAMKPVEQCTEQCPKDQWKCDGTEPSSGLVDFKDCVLKGLGVIGDDDKFDAAKYNKTCKTFQDCKGEMAKKVCDECRGPMKDKRGRDIAAASAKCMCTMMAKYKESQQG